MDTTDLCWTGLCYFRPELHHIIQCSYVVVPQWGVGGWGGTSVNKDPLSTRSDMSEAARLFHNSTACVRCHEWACHNLTAKDLLRCGSLINICSAFIVFLVVFE